MSLEHVEAVSAGYMKAGKAQGRSRTDRRSGMYAVGGAPADALTLRPEAPARPATLLGIPEAEFTPRVREAVIGLKSEVDRLTHENEQIRARLDDAARSADQDMLLPILNRRAFVREITRFIAFAERYGTPSSLLYFDLDNFKAVNDMYGHAAGDVVLRHFSDVIASQIRETDVLARLGGDEFGVILAHVRREQAVKKGTSLAKILRDRPAVWQGQVVKLNFSHGAYELRAGENADAAMAQADHAMYEEKRAGRETIIGS